MSKERPVIPTNKFDEAFSKQVDYDPANITYAARCGLCGKEKRMKKKWYRSRDGTIRDFQLEFNFCDACNRWMCEDCYLVNDGNGNGIGICRECGKKQGITGLTAAETDAAWPEIERQLQKMRETTKD